MMTDPGSVLSVGLIVGAVALFTNAFEVFVLVRKGNRRVRPEDMLLSLSASDILIALAYLCTLIAKFARRSIKLSTTREFMIAFTLLITCSIWVSICHILVIAVERVYAARFPLKYRVTVTPKLTKRIIAGIWLVAFVVLLVLSLTVILRLSLIRFRLYTGILILVTGLIIFVLYGYLTHLLRDRQAKIIGQENLARGRHHGVSRRNWNSLLALLLAAVYVTLSFPAAVVWVSGVKTGHAAVEWLIVVNSAVNPVLYFWKSYFSRREQRRSQAFQEPRARDTKHAEMSV